MILSILGILFYQFYLSGQIPTYVPINGLTGWWSFSGNALDESGNENHGIVYGPILSSDRYGKEASSYQFNGGIDLISTTNKLNIGNNYTISFWVQFDSITQAWLIVQGTKQSGSESYGFDNGVALGSDKRIRQYVYSSKERWLESDTLSYNKDDWYHVVYSLSGGGMKLYVNSTLVKINDTIVTSGNTFGYWRFGGCTHLGQTSLFGKLDDIGIWNRALSQDEIIKLYESTKPLTAVASTIKDVTCYEGRNGITTVVTSGGIPPYRYSWNSTPQQITQTAIDLLAGDYIVTVTDQSGSVIEASTTVKQPNDPLTIKTPIVSHVGCNGKSNGKIIVPMPSGGTSPYMIFWETEPPKTTFVLDSLKAGLYIGKVVDSNGCSQNISVTISEPNRVEIESPKDTTALIQTKVFFVCRTSNENSKFQWQTNTGTGYQYLEDIFQYTGTKTNTLEVSNCNLFNHNQPFRCIIETNGCYDTTAIAVLSVRTNVGVDEQLDSETCRVYPNPTGDSEELLVQLENSHSQVLNIELLDMMGISRVQTEIQSQNGIFPIAVSDIAKGMYIVRVTTSSGVLTQKIIVN
jgi:hypothetical protein